MKIIRFTKKGLYCIPGRFYLDPWGKVDYAVISHAHADHARWGMTHYLCVDDSKAIIKHRIGKDISIESLPYGVQKTINGVKLSFHPAGHIIGSAQIRLEYKGHITVFTGDYKTNPDNLTLSFQPVKCHTFITESTFGLPIYHWQDDRAIQQQIQNWVYSNQKQNKTSVFVGYSLGKSQRIMSLVDGCAPMFVHNSIYQLNEVIRNSGIKLPKAELWQASSDKIKIQNNIVIVPPALIGSNIIKRIPNAAVALCSGWMQIRGHRRWQAVDAGFVVSDHADWNGLLSAVKATEAEQVYVTHGYQATFSRFLNDIGIPAAEVKTEYGTNEDTESNEAETPITA